MAVADNFIRVLGRIEAAAKRANRDPSSVKLVVVTKTVDAQRIREAVDAGAAILGENRVQEARDKIDALSRVAQWHLIGRLQSNKAKYAVRLFDLIHSVDSISLARELDRQAKKIGKVQDVLIEVNVGSEAAKAGIPPDGCLGLIREIALLTHIRVRGLMAIPPFLDDPEQVRPYFRSLRELSQRIAREAMPNLLLEELSMGMSGDFEVAIEEGATMVRVGTAIFGERR